MSTRFVNTSFSNMITHDIIINAWEKKEELSTSLYQGTRELKLDSNGNISITGGLMETSYNPNGSKENLQKFLDSYVTMK